MHEKQYNSSSYLRAGISSNIWSQPSYSYRKVITINSSKINADLENFPVLIVLFDDSLRYHTQADGDDIIFVDQNDNILAHELEYYDVTFNSTHAHLIAWVCLPKLSSQNDTSFFMYYGNPNAANLENPNNVWDRYYRAVWHLSESGDGSINDFIDSTIYNNHGQGNGGIPTQIDGIIDSAQVFNSTNEEYISIPNSISLQILQHLTIEAWVKNTGPSGAYMGIAGKLDDTDDNGYALVRHSDNKFKFWVGDGTMTSADSDTTFTDTNWHHVVGVIDNGINYLYVDGKLQIDTDDNTLVDSGSIGHIGRQYYNYNDRFWNGLIDEVRISNVSRSADWLTTEYNNYYQPYSFYSIGFQEIYNDWGAPAFEYKKEIVINHEKVHADLYDFPMLLSIYDTDLRIHTQADGDDILFLDEFNQKLDHEIELFDYINATHAYIRMWIRIPLLSSTTDKKITMYYGNPTFESIENSAGVWMNNYAGVWHLGPSLQDSTSSGINGTKHGTTDETAVIGLGQKFDGIDDYIQLGVWDPKIGSGNYTISAWIQLDNAFNTSSSESMPIFGHYYNSSYNMAFTFAGQDNSHGSNGILYCKTEGYTWYGNYDYIDSITSSWAASTWFYLVCSVDQDNSIGTIYINGIGEGSMSNTGTPTFGSFGNYSIGRIDLDQTPSETLKFFEGIIDELRLSKRVLAEGWVITEYENQLNPQSFYSINLQELRDLNTTKISEMIIDTNVYDATDEYNPGPNVVFINDSHGYAFFQKTNGGISEIVYYKTTDNGFSWNGPINIDCGPPIYRFRSFSCWYDRWTPGNYGTKIHFIANSIDYDEMVYNSLDTKNDETGGNWQRVLDSGGAHNAPDGGGTVTISTETYRFCASWMTNGPQFAKYDTSFHDITPLYSILDDDDDHGQLLPLSNGDILCIYEDVTANELYSFVYHESLDAWDNNPTFLATITTGTETPEDDYNNNANWGAVLDPNTFNIYLVFNNDVFNATGDLETWIFYDSNRTWSHRSNVVTNVGIMGDEVKPAFDPYSDTLFAIYIIGNDIFVKNSTDGGRTWGEEIEVSIASESWIVLRTNFLSIDKIFAIYFDDVNDDVYGAIVVDLEHKLDNATIQVNVLDLDNKLVENAQITLTNSQNSSLTWTKNTTFQGMAIFTNLTFNYYNLTVKYKSSINDSLAFLEVFSYSDFQITPYFEYTIRIAEYSDETPPIIQNIHFENQSLIFNNVSTFFADVWDDSSSIVVKLNLTVTNISNGFIFIQGNFTMQHLSSNTYYNKTALDSLLERNVEVIYNIIAIDIANNSFSSSYYFVYLGDNFAPIIVDYNAIDFKNGTVEFYTNVTDNMSSIQDPVIIQIDGELFSMHRNESGFWVYRTFAQYGISLNYSIYSVKDIIGNENGSKLYTLTPSHRIIIPADLEAPIIIDIGHTFNSHDNGFVDFFVSIEDQNNYQSGVNTSSILIFFSEDGVNSTYSMVEFEDLYYFRKQFEFNITVIYWISAADLAGNIFIGLIQGPYIMRDVIDPIVSYWNVDQGNGTIDFFAEVIDWPFNTTSVFLVFTQDYFGEWTNLSMSKKTNTSFHIRVPSLDYHQKNVWFYICAVDEYGNWNNNGIYQTANILLEDSIQPVIFLTVENSTTNDCEITVFSYATDSFGDNFYVNNTFWIKFHFSNYSITQEMIYDTFYRYYYKYTFSFNERVEILVWVEDNAHNVGMINKTITIVDLTPPRIDSYGIDNHQNGNLTIWALIIESENGSGLLDNDSAVLLNFIYTSAKTVTMSWNGSGNYFSCTLQDFFPGQAFTYNITAFDKMGNSQSTTWNPYYVKDNTAPFCSDYGVKYEYCNHTAISLLFWAEAYDSYGSIKNLTLNLYNNNLSQILELFSNGTHYIKKAEIGCNQSYSFYLTVFDGELNSHTVYSTELKTLDFCSTEIIDYDIEYIYSNMTIGTVRLWLLVFNPFNDHEVYISIWNYTSGIILKDRILMVSNGTHLIFDLKIPYNFLFNYLIDVNDPGETTGYYILENISGTHRMLDIWPPSINEVGIWKINDTSILIWANVTDEGSGVFNVYAYIEFLEQDKIVGFGSTIQAKKTLMEFNQTHYISYLVFTKPSTLIWYIEASDNVNLHINSISKTFEFQFEMGNPIQFSSIPLEMIIVAIIVALCGFILLLSISKTYKKRKIKEMQHINLLEEKLKSILDVYMVLVTIGSGLPVYSINNFIYRSTRTIQSELSGLSVGIDTFLESFQSDFISYLLEPTPNTEVNNLSDNVRLSVIDKNKFKVLIISSISFKIFIFMKEVPLQFMKTTFRKIILLLEEKITLNQLGVIDESLITPVVMEIIQQFFPINLLSPFKVNINRLIDIEKEIELGKMKSLSKSSLNALKRLITIKFSHEARSIKENDQIDLYNTLLKAGRFNEEVPFLYNEALELLKKVLKIRCEEIYEILWLGSLPSMNLFLPYKLTEDIDHMDSLNAEREQDG